MAYRRLGLEAETRYDVVSVDFETPFGAVCSAWWWVVCWLVVGWLGEKGGEDGRERGVRRREGRGGGRDVR